MFHYTRNVLSCFHVTAANFEKVRPVHFRCRWSQCCTNRKILWNSGCLRRNWHWISSILWL